MNLILERKPLIIKYLVIFLSSGTAPVNTRVVQNVIIEHS